MKNQREVKLVEDGFERMKKLVLEELDEYKQALLETTSEFTFDKKMNDGFFTSLGADGFIRSLRNQIAEIDTMDGLVDEANDIINGE